MTTPRRTAALMLCALMTWASAATAAPEDTTKQLNTLRHGLGAAMGSALYHTHLFVGATADGFKGKVFEDKQIQEALRASAKVTAGLLDDLGRVMTPSLSKEDTAQLEELVAIGQLILEETRLLYALVQSPSPEAESAFAERHKRVRVRLGKLLGL